jgi:lambda family phage portal protein
MGLADFFKSKKKPEPSRRSFQGAMYNRLVSDWVASTTTMDAELRKDLPALRNRVRDLLRNNDYAKNAMRNIVNNVVGQGITMQPTVKMRRGGKQDALVNEQIDVAWENWCNKKTCHTAGILSFCDIERQIISAVAESGEVLVRMVRQSFGGGKIPFALEIIEADLLDERMNVQAKSGNEIRMGIERDEWGRPVAYHFRGKHPGDYPFGTATAEKNAYRIPASEIIHLYKQERPGQSRGVPWFASSILRLHHLNGYTEAEVIAARAEACRMGFITSPEEDVLQDGTWDGVAVSSFEPGKIERLQPGETFVESNPHRPSGQFEPFVRAMLRSMAAGVGVSYESLSRDYSMSNYSSSRLALLDDRDNWRVLQNWLIENFHEVVYDAWMDVAVMSGALPLQNYELNPDFYKEVKWTPRGWSWIDPAKEIQAMKDAVRCGFTTLREVVAQQGGDIDELFEDRQDELDKMENMNLVFDTDPSQVNSAGATQTLAPSNEGDVTPIAVELDA